MIFSKATMHQACFMLAAPLAAQGFSLTGPSGGAGSAFVAQTKATTIASRGGPLFVSVGMGSSKKVKEQESEKEEYTLQRLSDIIVDDELRLSQMSSTDVRCDEWFSSLLGSGKESSPLPESIVKPIRDMLLEKVAPSDCMDEVVKDFDNEEWTPYAQRTLKSSPFVPPYGLENYGIPMPRRGAEPWRQFDVPGMVSQDYEASPEKIGEKMELDAAQTVHANSCLTMGSSTWLADEECAARLVYIDGRYCPTLSKTSDEASTFTATNVLASSKGECDILSEQHIHALQHLTDGFTEIIPVDPEDLDAEAAYDDNQNNDPLYLAKLSGVDHRVGLARGQFALNNQQGTAAFAALNTLKCTNVALVDIPDGVEVEKPILIVNAYTTSFDKEEKEGVAYHPRLLVMGNRKSAADIIQASVDVDLTPAGEESKATSPPPRMHNGYSQIFVKADANITHTYVQENGGMVVPDVEDSGNDAARDAEAARAPLRDLYLECLDVHVMGRNANFKGNVLAFGGMGRSRVSLGMTLSKKGASGTINGLMLSGGLQRGDIRTNIHHVAQGCTSRQEQRNMVGGRASQTFKGRIRVEQNAQQTDSAQLARTILLTDKARIWAMPSLEIIADDVVCAHGATVSDLSQEELFYLRSRGLDTTLSRNLLMYAFVDEIGREVHPSLLGTETFGLKKRMIDRLQNLVPKGQRAVMGEFQSV